MKSLREERKYWEELLASEGLASIDWVFESVQAHTNAILSGLSRDNFFDYCARRLDAYDVRAVFYDEELVLQDKLGKEVGVIRPGHYSYHGLEENSHLEMTIHETFRGRWLWRTMLELFELYGSLFENPSFYLPEAEYSHKKSVISLLTQYFDYAITGKYVDGEWYEVTNDDWDEIMTTADDELLSSYRLERQ